jgi:hypothetical protein
MVVGVPEKIACFVRSEGEVRIIGGSEAAFPSHHLIRGKGSAVSA